MTDAVALGASAHPDRVALDDGGGGFSYRDLEAAVDGLARRLVTLGVKPGDTVGMLADICPQAVAAMYAAPRTGAALAPLSPALARRELRLALEAVRPTVLLCDSTHAALAREATRDVGRRVFVLGNPGGGGEGAGKHVSEVAPSREPLPRSGPDAVVAILRTSGTGGRARAIALTRANFEASAQGVRARLGLRPDDVWYASLSLAHIGGMALVHRALAAGSRVVVRGAYRRDALVEWIGAGRVTHVSLVPTMLRRLLDAGLPRPLPGPLRCVLVGGAGTPPALVERALAAGLPVSLTYGMTEACSQVATAPPALVRAKPGTVGAPLDGVEVRIAPDGEIELRGETVARAYYRGGAITGPDGWYATGDLGRLDRDGHLWVTGRKGHRIVSGGVNVDPADVEQVLGGHPSVAEAAVVGLPDPEWGEQVAAGVVAARGNDLCAETLHRYCREALGPAARPRVLRMLKALPRNPNGKVDRVRLAALLSEPGRHPDAVDHDTDSAVQR